jgi:ATP-dependent DNA helicase RecG
VCHFKIGYFASESDLRYHDEVHGDLFTQVSKTLELLLTKYLKAAISYEGIQRVESYPAPESALRETLLNAVIHRDYAMGAPIQIRVYADRLRIWNPGELPDQWSQAKLLAPHPSRPFNPDVANVFFRAGEIEAWGRGIQHVLEACRDAHTPEPLFRTDPGEISVEFPFSTAYLRGVADLEQPSGAPGGATQETTQEKIVALLRENPRITRKALAQQVGITPDGVKYHLGKLREANRIRHVGPTKKGRWEVLDAGGQP